MSISEIKQAFPDEWVLIGDPVMDESMLNVLFGIPLYHSKDKREVAYLGREKKAGHKTLTMIYTGTFTPMRKLVSVYGKWKR